jgi:hypothetical protein
VENRQKEVRRDDFSRMRAQHNAPPQQAAVPAGMPMGGQELERPLNRRERRAMERKRK